MFTLAGFVVGLIVGLTGIGGGALMTPLLIVGFGIPPLVAVSTDLLYAAFTKVAGVFGYARSRLIDWSVAGLLLLGSIPASLATLHWLSGQQLEGIDRLINITLGVSLTLTAVAVLARSRIQRWAESRSQLPLFARLARGRAVITVLAGVVLGSLVTLSSVGAGALGTAILILCYPQMTMARIVGTDLVHAVILTAVAGAGHYSMGGVDMTLLGSLLLGSIPGALLGSHFGPKLPAKIIQPVMALLLLGIGLRFVVAG